MFMSLAAAACLVFVAVYFGVPALTQISSSAPPNAASQGPGISGPGTSGPQIAAQMLPLSFELPADYRMAASDYDNGMTLYTLESQERGDVVLTMFPADEQPAGDAAYGGAAFGGSATSTKKLIIDGDAVPAFLDEAFMLLVFEYDDVYYTLSSRDDLGSLAAFYRSIVREP